VRGRKARAKENFLACAGRAFHFSLRMKRRLFPLRRAARAFTLVEILAVIAIIALLSALVLAISPGVDAKKKSAVSSASIRSMGSILENFKTTFGEYPLHDGASGDDEGWQRTLYACVTGLKILKLEDNKLRLLRYDEVSSADGKIPQRRPFASEKIFEVNQVNGVVPANEDARFFVDGWSNPLAYRYNVISSGALGTQWERPDFLLISAGSKFREPIQSNDFFSGSMESTGKVPDQYSDDPYRADNITNWNLD
jgi:prepilin-type N-terminal cleavage/methylation domain-containing protein